MSSSWTQRVLQDLAVRDELENKEWSYYNAFQQLNLLQRDGSDGKSPEYDEVLIAKINSLHLKLEGLEDKLAARDKSIKRLEKENGALHKKVEHLNLEVAEKNRAIDTINDELLSCNIQNNVLNGRNDHLSAENQALIERWMNKVRQDAERLNDANEDALRR